MRVSECLVSGIVGSRAEKRAADWWIVILCARTQSFIAGISRLDSCESAPAIAYLGLFASSLLSGLVRVLWL